MSADPPSLCTAQAAWQSVLNQLQLDMPRSSFDTWVQNTQVIASEDDTLTIGARDAYGRDWLESRLTSTVSRLLVGILNRSVAVKFTVCNPAEAPADEYDEPGQPDEIAIEPVQVLDYEQIVQPYKQIVVKGYLRRLGVEIGAKAIWLYIGFHQAAWRSVSKQGTHLVRSREVLRFSGISDGAFWRLMRSLEIRSVLGGLVERADPLPVRNYLRGRDGRPHRAPARYRVYLTPRLTISDASSLYYHLREALAGGQSLSGALQVLIETPDLLDGLLPSITETIPDIQHFTKLYTVMEVAQVVTGVALNEPTNRLCQELQRKVVNGLGDIHIRHYFVEQVIPALQLSPAQAWLISVARDMAYLNWRTGERREKVTFPGGYAEMAALAGISRYKTIQEWMSPGWKAHAKGGEFARFFTELETSWNGDDLRIASLPRSYRVLLDEPLLDANGAIMAGADGAYRQTPMAELAGAAGGNMADANGAVKNTLNTRVNTQKKNTSTTPLRTDTLWVEGADAPLSWELKALLQNNHVHPKVKRELIEAQASVRGFISWVLYACSPSAKGLSNPLGYAISQMRSNPGGSAGGAFERFASLSPGDLLKLIKSTRETDLQSHTPRINSPLWPAWKAAMGERNPGVLTARKILFGKGES